MPLLDCLPQPLTGETLILVIAHPDDEAMFFYPTISRAKRLHIICLSNGPHAWDPSVVAANVGPWLHARAVVVTFDRYGASGHANHVAVYHGAAPALERKPLRC